MKIRNLLLRNIRSSLGQFLSIVAIVALGSGFLSGLLSSTPNMEYDADEFFKSTKAYDYKIQTTLGINNNILKKLENMKFIKSSLLLNEDDVLVKSNNLDNKIEFRLSKIDFDKNSINKPMIKSGHLPSKSDECFVAISGFNDKNIKINDILSVDGKKYKVVGKGLLPQFSSVNGEFTKIGDGKIKGGIYIPISDSELDFNDSNKDKKIYSTLYITLNSDFNRFDKKYEQILDRYSPSIKKIVKNNVDERKNEILSDLDKAIKKLNDGENKLVDAKNKLNTSINALNKYENNPRTRPLLSDLENKLQDIDNKLKTVSNKKNSLREKYNDVKYKDTKIYLNTFEDNNSFSTFKSDVKKVASVTTVFPVFFFLVSALVVSTTISRRIEEDRVFIGTLKAIGYSNKSINRYYIDYGVLASIIGSVIGMSFGFTVFPKAIANSYKSVYHIPLEKVLFRPYIAIGIFLVTLICIILTIAISIRSDMVEKPASLLLPKAPLPGKKILLEKIPLIWKNLTFSRKVTLRNLFRYKKRFFMTIIGVSGSMALLITGFGIKDSIQDIGRIQFKDIYSYSLFIGTKKSYDKNISLNFKKDCIKRSVTVFEDKGYVSNSTSILKDLRTDRSYDSTNSSKNHNNDKLKVEITIPISNDDFEKLMNIYDYKTDKKIKINKSGVYINQKLGEELNLSTGSYTFLKIGSEIKKVKINGIFKNYIGNRVIMDSSYYKNTYKKKLMFNGIYAKADLYKNSSDKASDSIDKNKASLDDILSNNDVSFVIDYSSIYNIFEKSMKSLNSIVVLIIISASILNIVILYNLININIRERRKELATIEVLGFFNREIYAYIFREINILVFTGSIFGIPLGIFLHKYIIGKIESSENMFIRHINYTSYIYSFVLTIIFVTIVKLLMKRLISRINMATAMKSD